MKISRKYLRRLIVEELELCESWKSRNIRSRSTSGHIPTYGHECDPYLKMLVAITDPADAEEYINVYEEPDQDSEAECAQSLWDNLRQHYKISKPGKVKRALKKAKISDTKPRTVTDAKGIVIDDFEAWAKKVEIG